MCLKEANAPSEDGIRTFRESSLSAIITKTSAEESNYEKGLGNANEFKNVVECLGAELFV